MHQVTSKHIYKIEWVVPGKKIVGFVCRRLFEYLSLNQTYSFVSIGMKKIFHEFEPATLLTESNDVPP